MMTKILLVEQTSMLKMRLEKIFRNLNDDEILSYRGGIIPFDKYYLSNGPFQTVVIDIDQFLPDFDWMMDYLHANATVGDRRVIVLATDIKYRDIMSLYAKGADEIIAKPFGDDVIVTKLRSYMRADEQTNLTAVKLKVMGDMRSLKWSKEIELGVDEIDKEHKAIIENFDKLYALMKEGQGHSYYKELMHFLENYVDYHFAHEEELQQRIHYPEYEAHKSMHKEFRKQVKDLLSQQGAQQVTNAELIKLNLFMKHWILDHIIGEDRKIAAFIKK